MIVFFEVSPYYTFDGQTSIIEFCDDGVERQQRGKLLWTRGKLMSADLSRDELAVLEWLAAQKAPRKTPEEIEAMGLKDIASPDWPAWPDDFARLSELPRELRPNEEDVLRLLDDQGLIVVRVSSYLDPLRQTLQASDGGPPLSQEPPSEREWFDWFSPNRQNQREFQWKNLLRSVEQARGWYADTANQGQPPEIVGELACLVQQYDVTDPQERQRLAEDQRWAVRDLARLFDVHVLVTASGRSALARSRLHAVPAPNVASSTAGRYSARELAERHKVDAQALRKRLERWRKQHPPSSDFAEHDSPRKNQPRFLYCEDAVTHLIEDLKTRQVKRAKKESKKAREWQPPRGTAASHKRPTRFF